MATSTLSDMVIYEEQFYSGYTETLEQETDAFNAASRGCIILSSDAMKGQYEQQSYFDLISSLVARRDPTSVAVVADSGLTQSELVTVKLNRRAQVGFTRDQFRKIMQSPAEGSFIFGQQLAKAIMVDYLNSVLIAGVAAINTNAGTTYDATAGTMSHVNLVNGIALFGDKASSINCFVMHSKVYFDLVKEGITNTTYQTNSIAIMDGSTPTLGRPVIVTDSAALLNAVPAPDEYTTLGLTVNALTVVESEARDIFHDTISGLHNLVERVQYESAYNVGVKGYAWDIAAGGANPIDATLGTGTNWDKAFTDDKSTAGISVVSQ